MMAVRSAIAERGWVSVAERLPAVAALVALLYVFVGGRGHRVLDDRVAPHVWFAFIAAICLVLTTITRQRSRVLAIGSQLLALVLLGVSIAALHQGR